MIRGFNISAVRVAFHLFYTSFYLPNTPPRVCPAISSFGRQVIRYLIFFISVSIMRVSAFCCCIVLLTLVQSIQSYNPFDKFGVYCKPEAFSQRVSRKGCDSQYIRVKACLGTCASYAHPLDHPPYFKKVCECCKPSSTRWKVFSLQNCDSGTSPLVQVESAVNCKCSGCT